jgi:hypothetical protein
MLYSPFIIFLDQCTLICAWILFFFCVFFVPTVFVAQDIKAFLKIWFLAATTFVPGFMLFYYLAPHHTQEERGPAKYQWFLAIPSLVAWIASGVCEFRTLWVLFLVTLTGVADWVYLWNYYGLTDRYVPSRAAFGYVIGSLVGAVILRKADEREQRGYVGVLLSGINLIMFFEAWRHAYLGGIWDHSGYGFLVGGATAAVVGTLVVGSNDEEIDEGDWSHKED